LRASYQFTSCFTTQLGGLFNFGGGAGGGGQQEPVSSPTLDPMAIDQSETYKVPSARAAGRPHDLGWLDLLGEETDENLRLGKIPPGEIIEVP